MKDQIALNDFLSDIKWSQEEDAERQRWHEARIEEMSGEETVSWQDMHLQVGDSVFRPYLDSYPLSDRIRGGVRDCRRVLDLGGGSGNIAILIARSNPDVHVTSVDINPDAIRSTNTNSRRYGVESRVRAVESDIFANLDPEDEKYEGIMGNLPFVDRDVRDSRRRAVYDPKLRSYRSIFQHADRFLKKGRPIDLAYANFAQINELLAIANEYGYNCDITHVLRMNSIADKNQRLGLNEEYNVFERREDDRRVFYALRFLRG